MGNNGPFGFDPEDIDRVVREVGAEFRDAFDKIGKLVDQPGERAPWAGVFNEFVRTTHTDTKPETTGETGDGVWAIYTLDTDGTARVEQVYATELEALRAHKHNTDPTRQVRFLPYGVTVSVLDQPRAQSPGPDADD